MTEPATEVLYESDRPPFPHNGSAMTRIADLPNVERANRALEALWQSGLATRPRLEAEALEAAALRGKPARAFGRDDSWRAPLQLLLQSLREEAELNPLGLTMAHGQIVMVLRARMRAAALWRDHPEILDRPIPAPVIVLGQMRSGTTRLHRLLACDRRFAHTRLCETVIPVPYHRRPGISDARRIRARLGLDLMHRLNPELARIHPTAPSAPEEEFGLLSFGFGGAQFEAQWRVPDFARWWETADHRSLYREFTALLQTNAWFRGDRGAQMQLLKVPQFLQDLPLVLDLFPDARLICLHRRLDEVVPSSCSLVWNQMRVQSDSADPAWIGREWLRKTLLRDRIAKEALDDYPQVPRIHLEFEAMNLDWRREIGRVYNFLGLELTQPTLVRMSGYLSRSQTHLGHRYCLARFGLSPADLERAADGTERV